MAFTLIKKKQQKQETDIPVKKQPGPNVMLHWRVLYMSFIGVIIVMALLGALLFWTMQQPYVVDAGQLSSATISRLNTERLQEILEIFNERKQRQVHILNGLIPTIEPIDFDAETVL